ncbi:MAG: 16S rRNA processing protein RimM [bacterium]|nr:16S rRNA processing protein RimM [Candidatus Kapabacteria bacterium]
MSAQNRQRLGVLTRSFGLQGGIRCALDSVAVPQISTPCIAWIGYSESFAEERRLALTENHSGSLICYFDGVASRNAADALADHALWVEADRIRFDDQYSDSRLVGYRVRDEQGNDLGVIVGILGTRAQYVWTIAFEDREWMMPAVEEFVREIRVEEKLIVARPIPGMFDGEADEVR